MISARAPSSTEVLKRGDIIIFSWNHENATESRCGPHVMKFVHVCKLGVVLSSQNYHINKGESVVEQTLLSILSVGEFNARALNCPDHIIDTLKGRKLLKLLSPKDKRRSRFTRKHSILTELDIMSLHKSLIYHQQKERHIPIKLTVTKDVCFRPSQIRFKIESMVQKLDSIQLMLRLWISFCQWNMYCQYHDALKSSSVILLQKHIRRYFHRSTRQNMTLHRKWFNLHKEFPYIMSNSQLWAQSYRLDGTRVVLPTKHICNKWFSSMHEKILMITSVAMKSIINRYRYAWSKWTAAIKKQEEELRLMWTEEFYSYL